jgi:hypothetical protein
VPDYGLNAVIFAREVNGPLTGLVKQMDRRLEEASRRTGPENLGVFVVFCNDDPGLRQRLQDLAAKEGLKHVVLCATNSAGPPRYRLAREADLTALIYGGGPRKVAANVPLKKGELDKKRAKAILNALNQVLPK